MNFENNNNNPIEAGNSYMEMMNIWQQIQQLGRNDSENSTGLQIIDKVNNHEITPADGLAKMIALLESKQIH